MNIYQRSQQLWSILVLAAKNRQTLTYTMVSEATGLHRPAIGDALFPIQYYCKEKGFPALTALVVKEVEGIPGEGLGIEDLPRELQKIFKKEWLQQAAPKEEEFEAADRIHKNKSQGTRK